MKTIFPQTIQELSLQEKQRKKLLPMIENGHDDWKRINRNGKQAHAVSLRGIR